MHIWLTSSTCFSHHHITQSFYTYTRLSSRVQSVKRDKFSNGRQPTKSSAELDRKLTGLSENIFLLLTLTCHVWSWGKPFSLFLRHWQFAQSERYDIRWTWFDLLQNLSLLLKLEWIHELCQRGNSWKTGKWKINFVIYFSHRYQRKKICQSRILNIYAHFPFAFT